MPDALLAAGVLPPDVLDEEHCCNDPDHMSPESIAALEAASGTPEPPIPECIADGSHSDDLAHAAELRNRTGRHAPPPATPGLREALDWCLDYIEGISGPEPTRPPEAEPFLSERFAQFRAALERVP